jgi:hypothetical protein
MTRILSKLLVTTTLLSGAARADTITATGMRPRRRHPDARQFDNWHFSDARQPVHSRLRLRVRSDQRAVDHRARQRQQRHV